MTDIICDEDHRYWIENGTVEVPGVTNINQVMGISDFSQVPEQLLERSIKYGRAVHDLTQYYDRQTLNLKALDQQLLPILGQWQKFLKDYEIKLLPGWIEKVSYCQKWRYGFTPDRLAKMNNKIILIDIKTGAPSRATQIQTAAYRLGIEEETGDKINERWVIYLGADKYKIDPLDINKKTGVYDRQIYIQHKSIFLSCLNIYNYKKNGG